MTFKFINKSKIFIDKLLNYFVNHLKKYISNYSFKTIIEKNFLPNQSFKFVQIGANDGVSFDFLYDFVKSRNSSGLVVEPITEYYNELKVNYAYNKNINPINKAVHPILKNKILHKIDPNYAHLYSDWVKGIASFDPSHHLKLNIDSSHMISENCECISFDELINFNELSFNAIDLLQIDTEGFDYEIFKMINFDNFHSKIIKYEHVSLNNIERQEIFLKLNSLGYYVFTDGNDTIAIDISKLLL